MNDFIKVRGAKQHNLKNVDVEIPKYSLTVVTGPSGSGKSSLAFDTIYAEGQRRYVESLSAYARQFLDQMEKPDVESIEGLSPAISIDQKTTNRNPRSTVATVTEIYDYLRLMYSRIGIPHCPNHLEPIKGMDIPEVARRISDLPLGTKVEILAPVIRDRKGEYKTLCLDLGQKGFVRARVDGEMIDLAQPPELEKYKKHTIAVIVDRFKVKPDMGNRLLSSIETAANLAEGIIWVSLVDADKQMVFSLHAACSKCDFSLPELEPRHFSFNSPHGACPECNGLGYAMRFDSELIIPNPQEPLSQGAIKCWKRTDAWATAMLRAVANHAGFSMDDPFSALDKKQKKILLEGTKGVEIVVKTRKVEFRTSFDGVVPTLERMYRDTSSQKVREELGDFMHHSVCSSCAGDRLRPGILAVSVGGESIAKLTSFSVRDALVWIEALDLSENDQIISDKIIKEVHDRLSFLNDVGLGYLNLNRAANTLSGGESQRIRLATQIGSQLTGVLYVLDEPSIGLHQRDNARLILTLKKIRDLGNTVLVVEHDQETMESADYILDIGPGAGEHGGEIIASGTFEEILKNDRSETALYLSGRREIETPKKRKKPRSFIKIDQCKANNLKNISASFPLGLITVVCGVSGSGKSSLVNEILFKAAYKEVMKSKIRPGSFGKISNLDKLDKVIAIDQNPIGRTPRSNPGTYVGVFTPIRDLFASTQDAKARGYKPGRFSFNVKGGRCSHCEGDGMIKIEMHFLPDVYVECEQCKGKRYQGDTLEVLYKGKNIAEVLAMTVEDALHFFKAIPSIANKLQTLFDVGLGYIRLGQPATTLSGGEAQRIKLSKELAKRATGATLYILDEPTTGLHFSDVDKLLHVLQRLRDKGNTVVIIEHNLDVIKVADHLIEMGPEGGSDGGLVTGFGPPEILAGDENSPTGIYLKGILK